MNGFQVGSKRLKVQHKRTAADLRNSNVISSEQRYWDGNIEAAIAESHPLCEEHNSDMEGFDLEYPVADAEGNCH